MDVSIKEAAERLGVSVDTVRRRLKAGELEGRREPHGKSGYRWLVHLPDDAQASAPGMPLAEAYELVDARARIEGLERLIDELASHRDKLETERDDWKEAARRESDAARELRVLLKGAQDSTRALTATLEPQPAPGLPDTAHDARVAPTVAQAATEGAPETWRARFRRWIEG
jgi:excisionase family DNA binding protein